jgi:N-dimethylarginine dimethylaminohydrolase
MSTIATVERNTQDIDSKYPSTKYSSAHARLLMCAPDYYGVEYEINPWMHRTEQPDPNLARRQWRELFRVLTQDIGCTIQLAHQDPACPDMVFTANAALVVENIALLSRFRHPQRQMEETSFGRWFAENGYRVVVPPDDLRFEGEGDALVAGDTILAGYLMRSDIGSHEWISQSLGRAVLSLGLTDSRWYHLDTCLLALNQNLIAFYPGAFDEYGRKVLRSRFETIEINETEALRFACNSICMGRHVVMPAGCSHLSTQLTVRGFQVYSVEMSEFIKAGGAAKCLTLFLDRAADYCLPAASP